MAQPVTRRRFLTLSGIALAGTTTAQMGMHVSAATRTGSWRTVAALSVARESHTATVLDDRRVLIVDGWATVPGTSGAAVVSAEWYDPLADRWGRAATPREQRGYHTATLLRDGRVLVVGGARENPDVRENGNTLVFHTSAEIYDPLRDRWMSARPLANRRAFHTATLLDDGRVLVVGGGDYGDPLLTAEVYDPAADRWSAAGRLSMNRTGHTATLMPSGRVLVAGGIGGAVRDAGNVTCEVYIPEENRWVMIAPMREVRFGHAATLLPNGRLLVTGGSVNTSAGGGPTEAEAFRPTGGAGWSLVGTLRVSRTDHGAVLLRDGRVLLVGGREGLTTIVRATEFYDPATHRSEAGASLAVGRVGHTTTLLDDGEVLVVGGRDENSDVLASVERYTTSP